MTPPTERPKFRLLTAMRTDVGMRRATNQDSLAVVPPDGAAEPEGDRFMMVADGMGAHAAGELASKMAVDHVPHAYLKSREESAPAALRNAVRGANEQIHNKGASAHEFQGMGTTCTCLVASQGAVLAAHVGDSRIYRLQDGALEQLTFDHSLVWEMAAASNVSEDKVPSCIPKNVITRSLGPQPTVNVDLEGPHPLADGDVFLLCSDGLTGVVDDPLAAGILATLPPEEAAETLIDLANLRGGPDNISVIVARAESVYGVSGECAVRRHAPIERLAATAVAVGCLAGFGWFLNQFNPLGMLLTAAGSGAAIVYALLHRTSERETPIPRSLGGPYGNGPYRRHDAGDHAQAAGALGDLVRDLAALDPQTHEQNGQSHAGENGESGTIPTIGETRSIDWTPFAPAHAEAEKLAEKKEFEQAIRVYSELIRRVMRSVSNDDRTHRYRAKVVASGEAASGA